MTPKHIIIRAVKTFLQTLLALLGADAVGWLNAATTKQLGAAVGAAALSALTNLLTDLERH